MAEAKTKKVRVVAHQIHHDGEVVKHNSVVEMTDAQIKAHDGAVDADPAAVSYAEDLAAEAAKAAAKKA